VGSGQRHRFSSLTVGLANVATCACADVRGFTHNDGRAVIPRATLCACRSATAIQG
jgi:hypothetical protein